jgi:hypothetical protein
MQISDPDNEIAQAPASPPGEPPSPPGPPGLDKELEVRRVVMPVVTIDPHSFGVTSTKCNPDEFVTGGGYSAHPDIAVQGDHPDIAPPGILEWVVAGVNTGGCTQPHPIVCRMCKISSRRCYFCVVDRLFDVCGTSGTHSCLCFLLAYCSHSPSFHMLTANSWLVSR